MRNICLIHNLLLNVVQALSDDFTNDEKMNVIHDLVFKMDVDGGIISSKSKAMRTNQIFTNENIGARIFYISYSLFLSFGNQ